MKYLLFVAFVFCFEIVAAQEVVFEGFPSKRAQNNSDGRMGSTLYFEETREFAVKITKVGEQYFWASRENIPLIRTESGIYITYTATNGSGYIRTLNPTAREVFLNAPPNNQIGQITYIEHLLLGLESITYYGR